MSSYLFGSKVPGAVQATQNIQKYQEERAALVEAHFNFIIAEIEKKIHQRSRCLGTNSLELNLLDFPLKNHTNVEIEMIPLSETELTSITSRISEYLDKEGFTYTIPNRNHRSVYGGRIKIIWPKLEDIPPQPESTSQSQETQ